MSFSSDVKSELVQQHSQSRHCQIAELVGILELCGHVEKGSLVLETDNTLLLGKYAMLMREIFDFDLRSALSGEDTARVLETLKWPTYSEDLQVRTASGLLLQQSCCRRAFVRGCFLAAGSISDPNKSYHFEIVCHTRSQAEQLQKLLGGFEIDAKIVERKNHYVTYIKEGAHIVDALNVMGAHVALMDLENVRILKEMRNSVNRKVNCETANINKTVNAAVKQMEDILKIREAGRLEELPEQLQEMAQLRLQNPEATLLELGKMADPPVGKSGVNHRLRRLSEIAQGLL